MGRDYPYTVAVQRQREECMPPRSEVRPAAISFLNVGVLSDIGIDL